VLLICLRGEKIMMFYLGDWRGKQVYEGIDKIVLLFRTPWNGYLNPSLFHHKYIRLEKRQTEYNTYYYLTIHGEFVNHDKDVADSIADAVLLLIQSGALTIPKRVWASGSKNNISYEDIPRIIVYCHLDLFFPGVSELELFHDFPPELIEISKDTKIIETNTKDYNELVSPPLRLRDRCLIRHENTHYSNDYRFYKRHSFMDVYNRTKKLLDENNQYPRKFLEKHPITRLEFRLVRNNFYRYLTIYNLYGNYNKVYNRFSGALARLYKKYVLGLILIDTSNHPNINKVYNLSKEIHQKYDYFGIFRRTKRTHDSDICVYIMSQIINYYCSQKNNTYDLPSEYPVYDLFHPTFFEDADDYNNDLCLKTHQYYEDNKICCKIIKNDDKSLFTDLSLGSIDIMTFFE
jgi:hypothetical protein